MSHDASVPALSAAAPGGLKAAAILAATRACQVALRQPRFAGWKRRLWDGFVRPYLAWRPGIALEADTAFGARFHCALGDEIQGKLIFFGVWEPNLTAFLRRRLRPGDVFVDVGANIGYFTLLASRLVGAGGQVVSIEASPRVFATLGEHLARNGCANVRRVNLAVSDRPGMLRLYSGPSGNLGGTSTLGSRGAALEAEVPADRLDAVLTPEERTRARLIKIDIEGAEAPVLDTLIETIGTYGPEVEIVAEVNPASAAEFGRSAEDIIARFAALGFHAYLLENDYSAADYVTDQPPARPRRLREPLTKQADIVFSRVDAEKL